MLRLLIFDPANCGVFCNFIPMRTGVKCSIIMALGGSKTSKPVRGMQSQVVHLKILRVAVDFRVRKYLCRKNVEMRSETNKNSH